MSGQDVTLPEWLATLVGRLTIENEALRQQLIEQAQQVPPPPPFEAPPTGD